MNKYNIFININTEINKIYFTINNSISKKNVFYKNINLEYSIDDKLNFQKNFEKIFKEIILEAERKLQIQIYKINLMIENKIINAIEITIRKNFENKNIDKSSIEYSIQDIRQKIIENHSEKKIVHIVIKKCLMDNEEYNNVPIGKKCGKLTIELSFIYLQNFLVSKIESILTNFQIQTNRVICTNYAKSLLSTDVDDISQAGLVVLSDKNINEVTIYPKKLTKLGFFEKLFHIFS